MDIKAPYAIIFDWDNTLVDTGDAIADALNTALRAYNLPPWDVERVKKNNVRSLRESFSEWFGNEWEQARKIFYDRYHQAHLQLLKPMPDAEALLDLLATTALPLFVVSNKRGEELRLEVEHLGWTDRFAAIVGSLDAARDKPARDPVDLALSRAELKANERIWFVGDTYGDVECARNAGCTPVLVHNTEEADLLGVALAFSDCQALQKLLYTLLNNNKTA